MTSAEEGFQAEQDVRRRDEESVPAEITIGDMFMSATIGALGSALAGAQGNMSGATKSSRNDHFKNDYADLADCIAAWREPLSKAKIALVQLPYTDEGKAGLTTMLIHSSGEYIGTRATIAPQKPGAHAFGSCVTYLRRYCGSAITGVAQADDDANIAMAEKIGKPVGKPTDTKTLEGKLREAAKAGSAALKLTWESAEVDERMVIGNTMAEFWQKLKSQAADVDTFQADAN